ncbi:MAG: hypothetical protein J7647_11050 [Cyanobacteria bacterium SBLK]|nr:hypothetical protein [Cyanobacteria bacterium SBLK]
MGNVKMELSKKKLRLQVGSRDRESEFIVTVINQSDKFVSFKPNLSIRELNQTAENDWYRIEPSFCAKKPPGDITEFKVTILKSPLKLYNATIELQLKVFAIEDPYIYAEDIVYLIVERSELPLKLLLPIKHLKVLPGEDIEIPIVLYNLIPNIIDITLNISTSGLQKNWFKFKHSQFGEAKKFAIEPAEDIEEVCIFSPPNNFTEVLRDKYEFKIEAKNDRFPADVSGTIEILPKGEVEFEVIRQPLNPANFLVRSFRNRRTYRLKFKNNSNLKQQVILDRKDIVEIKKRKFNCKFEEHEIILSPGEAKDTSLTIWKERTWLILFKFKERFQLKITPNLIDPESGKSSPSYLHPESQIIDFPMFLMVQFILQIFALGVSIGFWWFSPLFGDRHQSSVNAVRFNRDASTVVSGSSDRTLRRWQVNKTAWPAHHRLKDGGKIQEQTERNGKNIEQPDRAIQTIRVTPDTLTQNNIFVVGLEDSGAVQLWDINQEKLLAQLNLVDKKKQIRNNRIFSTYITDRYLFTGHGSNTIYQWDLNDILNSIEEKENPSVEQIDNLPVEIKRIEKKPPLKPLINFHAFNFVPLSLAVSEEKEFLILAGRYNKLAFWKFGDSQNQKIYEGQFYWQLENDPENRTFKPILGQHSYITSLAIAEQDKKSLLVMADNNGYITIWNLNKIYSCIQQEETKQENIEEENNSEKKAKNFLQECDAIIDQWPDDQWSEGRNTQPVRSVAITPNGCYLASAGDDGRVKLWLLDEAGKRIDEKILGDFSPTRLNSVDIKEDKNYLWVVSDAESHGIQLYRTKIDKADEERCL